PAATETWYDGLDQDCDGAGDFDRDGDGFLTDAFDDAGGIRGDDCDDASVAVNPSATEEWYDGVDQDCAGDDDYDQDHDGFATGDDCDDLAVDVSPGALETCGNTVDEDCSGSDNDADALGCSTFFADADGDTWGGADEACLCRAEGVYTATYGDDCDDGDDAINPGGTESCLTDGDDDCDGSDNAVDAIGCTDWYTDADSDGYGTSVKQCACEASGVFRADEAGDCNDGSASVRPGATETCNSADDDCDGSTDEGLPLYYADADGDSYGAGTGTCSSSGRVANDDDCDDASAYVYPGAAELCDGEPNDCTTSGSWSEADEDQKVSYVTTAGAWSDVSTSFDDATSTNVQLNSTGTYYFCAGTYYTKLIGNADTVDVVGMYGAERTELVNNATSGTTLSVTNGSVTVSGLTFSGGVGSGSSGSTYGGGVIASATPAPSAPNLVMEDCIVTDNDAAYGAGVAVYTSGWASLVRTTVRGNAATLNGGGVWVSQNGKLTMTDSEISANTATSAGGGLYVYSTGAATLTGTAISGNTSPGDGGGVFLDDGTLTMTTSTISGNSATDDGGGLFIDTGVATCTSGGIYDNTAGDEGGGVYLSNHASSSASFTSVSCDYGTGSLDNSPTDVTVKTSGDAYREYTSYGATASFVCTNASDLCG
ncbi:MAG: MopE-related protein, partial [Myxococcota bacterium]